MTDDELLTELKKINTRLAYIELILVIGISTTLFFLSEIARKAL